MQSGKQRCLVVVSYYDQRAPDELTSLLDQVARFDAGLPHDVLVVVNSTGQFALELPARFAAVQVVTRANQGFNVGAWQHGWREKPDYDFYLFLQDECFVRKSGWLRAFVEKAVGDPRAGFIGESLNCYASWGTFEKRYRAIVEGCRELSTRLRIPMTPGPNHLQTLVMGATRQVLERTGGFVTDDDKVLAMAGEVMTSVRAGAAGLRNRQVAWLPFEFIGHPQWNVQRAHSKRWLWSAFRCLHLCVIEPSRRIRVGSARGGTKARRNG